MVSRADARGLAFRTSRILRPFRFPDAEAELERADEGRANELERLPERDRERTIEDDASSVSGTDGIWRDRDGESKEGEIREEEEEE